MEGAEARSQSRFASAAGTAGLVLAPKTMSVQRLRSCANHEAVRLPRRSQARQQQAASCLLLVNRAQVVPVLRSDKLP
jgi:hypothetical protein